MNRVSISGYCNSVLKSQDYSIISQRNFVLENMLTSRDSIIVKASKPCALTPKTIHYDPQVLKGIQQCMLDQHDYRYKTLPIQAIKVIRSLKLNCKRRRHLYTSQKRQQLRPTKSHKENLIMIKRGSNKTDTNLIINTCNI